MLDAATLTELQDRAARVACDDSILQYVVQLVRDTRAHPRVRLGASPRAAQALLARPRRPRAGP
ncbi:hypothetical protein ACLEQD_43315, partial [Corallococcus sp. 4LFB]